MDKKRPQPFSLNVLYGAWLAVLMGLLFSCSSNTNVVNPTGTTTKITIINASPDAGPVAAFINNQQLGGVVTGLVSSASARTYFRYSSTPQYYGIASGLLSFQLRNQFNVNVANQIDTTIVANKGYSLFLVGLKSVDSLSTIFTADTSAVATITQGRGKVRFINTSPRTPALDVYANSTLAFAKIPYKKVSPYIELPAGSYDFVITANGTGVTKSLTDLAVTVQDGKLYTIYTKGLIGRTDTAALSLSVITNK